MSQIKNRQSCESGAPYLEMFPHATPPCSCGGSPPPLEKAHGDTASSTEIYKSAVTVHEIAMPIFLDES
jgi:hypothetical protein